VAYGRLPPDLPIAISSHSFSTSVAKLSFCSETTETFETVDLAETSYYCRQFAPPSPPMDPPLPTRQRISEKHHPL